MNHFQVLISLRAAVVSSSHHYRDVTKWLSGSADGWTGHHFAEENELVDFTLCLVYIVYCITTVDNDGEI